LKEAVSLHTFVNNLLLTCYPATSNLNCWDDL